MMSIILTLPLLSQYVWKCSLLISKQIERKKDKINSEALKLKTSLQNNV